MRETHPRLHLLAGINGAGKSTFYETFLRARTPGLAFVNADELALELWPGDPAGHAYEAAQVAAALRADLLEAGRSFVSETVFSHPSKLALIDRARERGFEVLLYYISVGSAELAALRVETRVQAGGHAVPAEKIHARFPRTRVLALQAVEKVDRAYVLDNSRHDRGFTHVMTLQAGEIVALGSELPRWAQEMFAAKLRVGSSGD